MVLVCENGSSALRAAPACRPARSCWQLHLCTPRPATEGTLRNAAIHVIIRRQYDPWFQRETDRGYGFVNRIKSAQVPSVRERSSVADRNSQIARSKVSLVSSTVRTMGFAFMLLAAEAFSQIVVVSLLEIP